MDQQIEQYINGILGKTVKQEASDDIKSELLAYLFKHYCNKEYLSECEPEYCSFRYIDSCRYIEYIQLIKSRYDIDLIS